MRCRTPAVPEFVPGYEGKRLVLAWRAQGHAGRIIAAQQEINAGVAGPQMKARLADLGASR